MNTCPYFPRCTGCSHRDLSYDDQRHLKVARLQNLFSEANVVAPEPEFISCGQQGLRHRMDFTIQFNEATDKFDFGFYDQDRGLLDISECRQLAPELQSVFAEFRAFKFFHGQAPLKKGSVRLRVGPGGIKGCWLDFSNLDIKEFLADQTLLLSLLHAGYFVEIGQKGKKLIQEGSLLKLSDPSPQIWFATQGLAMLGLISDFTQPSWITGNALVAQVDTWLKGLDEESNILEFGAGLGQFTLPFLKKGLHVRAFELSESAVSSLRASARLHQLEKHLSVFIGDFHRQVPAKAKADLAFVNPARSGLKNFNTALLETAPEKIIYVSCFPESMIEDAKVLSGKYKIESVKIIDQFPQTSHFESCMLLKKI